jgi:hypothetical protein
MEWSKMYWFVIESIVSQTTKLNNQVSLDTLTLLGMYLPCQDCRNHYSLFVQKNTVINEEWLAKLKREITITKRQTHKKKCCGKKG